VRTTHRLLDRANTAMMLLEESLRFLKLVRKPDLVMTERQNDFGS
jgi:hypothetical protein